MATFQITKRFTSGFLAGLTIVETMPFEMPLGAYKGVAGESEYLVTNCEVIA
jgi:hypothetical protein